MGRNEEGFHINDLPHLKEKLQAFVQEVFPKDEGRAEREWARYKGWAFADLYAAWSWNREEVDSSRQLIAWREEGLNEQDIDLAEVVIPDSPRPTRRVDVPVPLLEMTTDDFSEIEWDWLELGSHAWQWRWVERQVTTEAQLSNASYRCQVLGTMLNQLNELGQVSDMPPTHLASGRFFMIDEIVTRFIEDEARGEDGLIKVLEEQLIGLPPEDRQNFEKLIQEQIHRMQRDKKIRDIYIKLRSSDKGYTEAIEHLNEHSLTESIGEKTIQRIVKGAWPP